MQRHQRGYNDIIQAAEPLQTCATLKSGKEAAIHSVQNSFWNVFWQWMLKMGSIN